MRGYGHKIIFKNHNCQINENIGEQICKIKEIKPIYIEKWENNVNYEKEGVDQFFGINIIFHIGKNTYLKKHIELGIIHKNEKIYHKTHIKKFYISTI